jgi:hypothetical protein
MALIESRWLRIGAGIALALHGLAHAVFALRGSAGLLPTAAAAHGMLIAYSLAITTFVAAGVGLMGSRALYLVHVPLMVIGVCASAVALALAWNGDFWIGLVADMLVVWYLWTRAASARALPPRDPRRFLARTTEGLAVLFVAYVAIAALLWPWHRSWGTTEPDWALTLPGDPPARLPSAELMHAIDIDAPDWVVWAWLVQIGQDRAGFYSYERLERLFGADIHNASAINPAWQHRAVGDRIPATQERYAGGLFGEQPGWTVTEVVPCRALVLDQWGSFVVLPNGPDRSRLLVRSRMGGPDAPAAGAAVSFLAFEIPLFIMEREESPRGQIGASPCGERAVGERGATD